MNQVAVVEDELAASLYQLAGRGFAHNARSRYLHRLFGKLAPSRPGFDLLLWHNSREAWRPPFFQVELDKLWRNSDAMSIRKCITQLVGKC
jgi:hypothetical protein